MIFRIVVLALCAAFASLGATANAGNSTVHGNVKSVDTEAKTITLELRDKTEKTFDLSKCQRFFINQRVEIGDLPLDKRIAVNGKVADDKKSIAATSFVLRANMPNEDYIRTIDAIGHVKKKNGGYVLEARGQTLDIDMSRNPVGYIQEQVDLGELKSADQANVFIGQKEGEDAYVFQVIAQRNKKKDK